MATAVQAGCADQQSCVLKSVPLITVHTHDAVSGHLVCDAVIRIQDGAYEETLKCGSSSGECYRWSCYGANVRPGHYEVTVSAPGYVTETTAVDVPVSECNFDQVSVDIHLKPQ